MKKFYELDTSYDYDRKFMEVSMDEFDMSLTTRSGKFYNYHIPDAHKVSVKKYKKVETAQRNFEKKCKELEGKGYVLSDAQYPLKTRRAIEGAKANKVPKLEVVIFHEGSFEKLVELTHLTHLEIESRGDDMEIPESITKLKNLETLTIENSWKSLPDNLGELKNLKSFYIRGYYGNSKLKKIPLSLCECVNLEKLQLSGIPLKDLPPNIGKLVNLEELDCERTEITSFPLSIGDCKKLKKITVESCSNLSSLPDEFAQLDALEYANFRETQFKQIPEQLCQLKNLKELHFSQTKITSLPESIGNLTKLENLQLNSWGQKGSLNKLPKSFSKLKNLRELDLYNQSFTEVPTVLKDLPKLSKLDLMENSITDITSNILNLGKDAVFRHLGWVEENKTTETESLLTAGEQATLMATYGERLDAFKKKAKKSSEINKSEVDQVYDFLTFQTDKVPIIAQPYYYNDGGFKEMSKIFSPFNEWTEVEDRLMIVLTENGWSKFQDNPLDSNYGFDGYAELFYAWYKEQIKLGKEPAYEDIVETLKKYGKEKLAFEMGLSQLYKHLEQDGKPTKFGQVALEEFAKDRAGLLKKINKEYASNLGYGIVEAMIDLFINQDLKGFAPFVDEWFVSDDILKKAKTNSRGSFNMNNLRTLIKANPKKYESLIKKVADTVNDEMEQVQLAMDLKGVYGDKHKDLTIGLFKKCYGNQNSHWGYFSDIVMPDGEQKEQKELFVWVVGQYKAELKDTLIEKVARVGLHPTIYIETLLTHYPEEVVPIVAQRVTGGTDDAALVYRLLKNHDYSEHHDKVWAILKDSSKISRAGAARELNRLYPEKTTLPKAKELLKEGKGDLRDGGVQLLMGMNTDAAKKTLQIHLKTETSDSLREVIIAYLNANGISAFGKKEAMEAFKKAKEAKKLDKPAKKWMREADLPPLYWKDGKKVDPQMVRFLFFKQKSKEQNYYEPAQETLPLLAEIDQSKSGPFAKALLDLILANDGLKATAKAFVAFTTALGDEQVLKPIAKYCKDKNSVLPAALLGNMEGEKVARTLDALMIHYKTKYPNIREAASESFDKVAAKMGLSRMELMDKMIPDFGFVNLFKEFDVNGETWKAFINSNLKLSFLNELDEAKKTISSKASKEVKDEIKQINKEIRSIARQQKSSLELNFMNGRQWPTADWDKHFMKKPLMFAFAQSLIWGIYKDEKLVEVFGISEDQTLENADFDEIELPKDAQIGMIHPIELDKDQLTAWQSYLKDNSVTQPFEQLHRAVIIAPKKEHKETILDNFKGEDILCVTFKNFMEKRGWLRGSVVDGGAVESYRKRFEGEKVEAFIRIDYMSVVIYDYDEKTNLEELFFTQLDSFSTGSYVYDSYKDENDKRLIKVKDVPPLVYSETMNDLQLLLAKRKNV